MGCVCEVGCVMGDVGIVFGFSLGGVIGIVWDGIIGFEGKWDEREFCCCFCCCWRRFCCGGICKVLIFWGLVGGLVMGNIGEEFCVVIDFWCEFVFDLRCGVGGGLGVCGLFVIGICIYCIVGDDVVGCVGFFSIMVCFWVMSGFFCLGCLGCLGSLGSLGCFGCLGCLDCLGCLRGDGWEGIIGVGNFCCLGLVFFGCDIKIFIFCLGGDGIEGKLGVFGWDFGIFRDSDGFVWGGLRFGIDFDFRIGVGYVCCDCGCGFGFGCCCCCFFGIVLVFDFVFVSGWLVCCWGGRDVDWFFGNWGGGDDVILGGVF